MIKLKRKFRKPPTSVKQNIKVMKHHKYYKFLRSKIIKKFGVSEDIRILTEQDGSLYHDWTFVDDKKKQRRRIISTTKIAELLKNPENHHKLKIKKILKYYCIYFNESYERELFDHVIKPLKATCTTEIQSNNYTDQLFKPFIFVLNDWDDEIIIRKFMCNGTDNKRAKKEEDMLKEVVTEEAPLDQLPF